MGNNPQQGSRTWLEEALPIHFKGTKHYEMEAILGHLHDF